MQEFLGVSAAAAAVREEIDYAANSDAKVLITGESGVGKEVVARLIHHHSRRRLAPLVTINCAGVPDSLLASELFGHVRGSFTDAYRDKIGWIEQAHRGTIFMDEIGEMSGPMQSLLLRFLENGEIQRVGSDRRATTVDVRVITATNRRLVDRVAAGEFREDLFYRLNVIHIEIPPLRDRREDIPALVAHFIKHFSDAHGIAEPTLSPEAGAALQAAAWRGNVRQLRNVAERLVVRSNGQIITMADLPREILAATDPAAAPPPVRSRADVIFEGMLANGQDFWKVVYDPFMARDLTRDDLRTIVRRGLEITRGNYRGLADLFNVAPAEYKKLLNFLRKFDCHLPIHDFRSAQARLSAGTRQTE